MGVWVSTTDDEQTRIAMLADQVQEFVIEELWSHAPTNWPPCPQHPDTHPLIATVVEGVATWVCPREGTPCSAVGSLDQD